MILGSSARFSNTIYLDLARFSNFSENIPSWVRSTVCLCGSVGGHTGGLLFPCSVSEGPICCITSYGKYLHHFRPK